MLYDLDISQVVLTKHMGDDVFKITSFIVAPVACKTTQGGLKNVNDNHSSVTIWKRLQLNGQLCIFEDIKEYIDMGEGIHRSRTKVFLADNYFGKKTYKINRMFFKNCNLGEEILPRYIKEACDAVWVIGE